MDEIEQPELEGRQPEPEGRQPEPEGRQPEIHTGFSGWWLLLVFLISMGALVVSTYLGYELIYKVTNSSEASETDKMRSQFNALKISIATQLTENRNNVQSELQRQDAERLVLEDTLASQANALINRAPPGGREWKLAEVEYLLRIANHRLLLEKDVRGTIQLLNSADLILQEMDDFSLHGVRTRISEELQSLGNISVLDYQGLFLRIEALKTDIEKLPLRLPRYIAPESDSDNAAAVSTGEEGAYNRFMNRIGSMFEFRSYPDEGFRPLLQPDEAGYLEMNLRLMLERAQLALLKRDAVLYSQSLASSKSWLIRYLDSENDRTQGMLSGIDALLKVEIAVELPSVSGSLNHLLELRRPGAADPS